jgi:PEP-CTERM motif
MRMRLLLLAAVTGTMFGGTVTFIPPTDPTGQVFTTNNNDGYAGDRGLLFLMGGDSTIDSVGIFQDLTGVDLTYTIYQTPGLATVDESGFVVLQTGTSNVTTNGLEWIDFNFAPLTLTTGNSYYIAFSFSDPSNQNFFYDNGNTTWGQGNFTELDGANGGDTGNTVLPAILLDEQQSAVPEPGSFLLGGLGLAAVGLARFRRA